MSLVLHVLEHADLQKDPGDERRELVSQTCAGNGIMGLATPYAVSSSSIMKTTLGQVASGV